MATNTVAAAATTSASMTHNRGPPSQPTTNPPPMNQSNTTTNDNDNNSVLDLAEQTQRPVDNAFNQQRVNAWHPILDPVFVIIGLFYLGVIMVPTGKLLAWIYKRERIRLSTTGTTGSYFSFLPSHSPKMLKLRLQN